MYGNIWIIKELIFGFSEILSKYRLIRQEREFPAIVSGFN